MYVKRPLLPITTSLLYADAGWRAKSNVGNEHSLTNFFWKDARTQWESRPQQSLAGKGPKTDARSANVLSSLPVGLRREWRDILLTVCGTHNAFYHDHWERRQNQTMLSCGRGPIFYEPFFMTTYDRGREHLYREKPLLLLLLPVFHGRSSILQAAKL